MEAKFLSAEAPLYNGLEGATPKIGGGSLQAVDSAGSTSVELIRAQNLDGRQNQMPKNMRTSNHIVG